MARGIDEIPGPHWDPKAKTLRQYLEALATAAGTEVEKLNTRPERLRWMHKETLGCAKTFEFRREEMAILEGRPKEEVTDEEVVECFIQDIEHQDGALRQYLEHGSLAAVVGNTLFVHGAVDAQTVGFIPAPTRFELPTEKQPAARMTDDVEEWVAGLNHYLRQGLEDYASRPLWDASRSSRGGEALLAIQNREAMFGRSVVSNCFADGGVVHTAAAVARRVQAWKKGESQPLAFGGVCSDPRDPAVAQWLLKNGIRRVVVGHKPAADCPAVLAASSTGVEVVSADTSFSDTSAPDARGAAVTSVLIEGEPHANHLTLDGVLKDGRRHHGRLHTLGGAEDGTGGNALLGTEAQGGWWYKALLLGDSPALYRQTRGEGRHWETRDIEVTDG